MKSQNNHFTINAGNRKFSLEYRYDDDLCDYVYKVHYIASEGCNKYVGDFVPSNNAYTTKQFKDEFLAWVCGADLDIDETPVEKPGVVYEMITLITEGDNTLSKKRKLFYDKDRAKQYLDEQNENIKGAFNLDMLTMINTRSDSEIEYIVRSNNTISINISFRVVPIV